MIEKIDIKCKIYKWDENPDTAKEYNVLAISHNHPGIGLDSASLILDLSSFTEEFIDSPTKHLKLIRRDTTYRIEVYFPEFMQLKNFLIFKGIIAQSATSIQNGNLTLNVQAVSDFQFLDLLTMYLSNKASTTDAVFMTQLTSRLGVPYYLAAVGSISMYLYTLFKDVFPDDKDVDLPSLNKMVKKILQIHKEYDNYENFNKLIDTHIEKGDFINRIITSIYTEQSDYKINCKTDVADKTYLLDYLANPIYNIYTQDTLLNFATNSDILQANGTQTSFLSLLNKIFSVSSLLPNIQYIRTETNNGPKPNSYLFYKPSLVLFRPPTQNFIPIKFINNISFSSGNLNIPTRNLLEIQHPYLQDQNLASVTIDITKNSAVAPLEYLEENVKVIKEDLNVEEYQRYIKYNEKGNKKPTKLKKDYTDLITPEEESRGYIAPLQQVDSKSYHFLSMLSSSNKVNMNGIYKLIKVLSEYKLEEARLMQINGAFTMPYNPYLKPGFPCLLIDRDNPENDLYAYIENINHNLSPGSVTTIVHVSGIRPAYVIKNSSSSDENIVDLKSEYDVYHSQMFNLNADDTGLVTEMVTIEPIWLNLRNYDDLLDRYKTCSDLMTKYYSALGMWWLSNSRFKIKEYKKSDNGQYVFTGKYKTNPSPYEVLIDEKYYKDFRDPKDYFYYYYMVLSYELSEHYAKVSRTLDNVNKIELNIDKYNISKDTNTGETIMTYRDISGEIKEIKIGKKHTAGRWVKYNEDR